MTDALVRLGLPNSLVVLVLAVMPLATVAMAPALRADMSRADGVGTVVAGIGTPADATAEIAQ
ncbi:MAG TPA: hypothetical protein VH249_00890 [Xanthobacteraceae bacterium]|jgi:hypothetical protein|nr:hypothetical protein [Xanthobacteraceae bacterium]